MIETVLFYTFASVLVGAALGVITSRNPVHSALFLVLAFVTSACLWVMMEAEFLGIALVLVYVGAVMVLFLFVVMMLDINVAQAKPGFTRYAWLGAIVTVIVAAEIIYVVGFRDLGLSSLGAPAPRAQGHSNTEALGAVLYTDFVWPFELAAIILLVAIVAAISLTMRKRPGLKVQNISKQVAVKRADRVRLVSMEAEQDT